LSLASWGEYQDIPFAVRASNRWEGGFAAVLQEPVLTVLEEQLHHHNHQYHRRRHQTNPVSMTIAPFNSARRCF